MRRSFYILLAIAHIIVPRLVSGQTQPANDPQAVAFAAQSITAITGGTGINDATLTGIVTWTIASDTETGSVTLLALGTGESRVDLVLPNGTRTEIRDASTGTAQGKWLDQSGASGFSAPENCMTDAVWFFPALGSLAAGPNVVLSYIGQESRNGGTVQHLQSYVYQTNPLGVSPSPQQLSTMDIYLDATTLLPVGVTFNAHPDDSPTIDIPIEIDFANYQIIGGLNIPTHIQKYFQGTLIADLAISSAAFNTGISLSSFAVN